MKEYRGNSWNNGGGINESIEGEYMKKWRGNGLKEGGKHVMENVVGGWGNNWGRIDRGEWMKNRRVMNKIMGLNVFSIVVSNINVFLLKFFFKDFCNRRFVFNLNFSINKVFFYSYRFILYVFVFFK